MNQFFISDQIGADKLCPEGELTFGRANYSWKIISGLYQQGLRRAGFDFRKLVRPETYYTETARRCLGLLPTSFHLAVKPIEELRPLVGVRNVYVCGWEFPELSESDFGLNPFYNQRRVLQRADHLLCWSDFTTNSLKRAGVTKAITLPPPVVDELVSGNSNYPNCPSLTLDTHAAPGSEQPRPLEEVVAQSAGKRRFVTVLNPFDLRKNLPSLLQGFAAIAEGRSDLMLIVKLVVDNIGTSLGNINELLKVHHGLNLRSEHIHFVGQELTDVEMRSFLANADFYLCASTAEGLNLPLVSALIQGVPAVSTRNTAMSMYLSDECSFEIMSTPQRLKGKGHVLADHMEVTHFVASQNDVTMGIKRAMDAPASCVASMKHAAQSAAEKHFGQAKFEARLDELLKALR